MTIDIQAFDQAGYVVLRAVGTGEDDLDDIIGQTGVPCKGTFWGAKQYVVFDPAADASTTVASTVNAMPLHTDGSFEVSPPRFLYLQCAVADHDGFGESLVADLHSLLGALSPDVVRALHEPAFSFRRIADGKEACAQAAVIDSARPAPMIRFRHDNVYRVHAASAAGTEAVEELAVLLASGSLTAQIRLRPGDVVWLDNHRVLHGRTPLSGEVSRTLRVAWAQPREPSLHERSDVQWL